jgi:hypothetical protein
MSFRLSRSVSRALDAGFHTFSNFKDKPPTGQAEQTKM